MTDKTIKELIEEARELGIDLHTHVANEMFGVDNMRTRHRAKEMSFCALYGGAGRATSKNPSPQNIPRGQDTQNSKSPRKMTEEQHKAQSKVMSRQFLKQHMGEPFTHFDDCPAVDIPQYNYRPPTTTREVQQAEDRMCRVGIKLYKVRVSCGGDAQGTVYTIRATSGLDARCMAFVLDSDCPFERRSWDDEHIDLAMCYTKVVG